MLDDHVIYVAAAVNFLACFGYVSAAVTGTAQPNRVSWFIWSTTAWLAFLGQLDEGVAAPALLTLSAAAGPLLIFLASFVQLDTMATGAVRGVVLNRTAYWKPTRLDLVCAVLSVVTLVAWRVTASGNVAIALSIAADLLAGIPTVVKACRAPQTETRSPYIAGIVAASLTLLALDSWTFSTAAFAVYFLILSSTITVLLCGHRGTAPARCGRPSALRPRTPARAAVAGGPAPAVARGLAADRRRRAVGTGSARTQAGSNPPFSPAARSRAPAERQRPIAPTCGWRRTAFHATGGGWNPGPSREECRRRNEIRQIRTELDRPHRIAVLSLKGGVGKTTVAALLGVTLAEYRADRIVAFDADPDAGTLADRTLGRPATLTVRDLVTSIRHVVFPTDLSRFTGSAGRLEVLAAELRPGRTPLAADECAMVHEVLRRFVNICVIDCGTGLTHAAVEEAVAHADTAVVVGTPTIDGADRANRTSEWLAAAGHRSLAREAVIVLCDLGRDSVAWPELRAYFEQRCRAVVEIPYDPHLAVGGQIEMDRLRGPTLAATRSLAAAVADGFVPIPARCTSPLW